MKKITAIITSTMLEAVEAALQRVKVPGISVSAVKGYGEYANFFAHDWMVRHTKIEIFIGDEHTAAVVQAIVAAAQTGGAGDGIVAVQPADTVVRIRDAQPLRASSPPAAPPVAAEQNAPASLRMRGVDVARNWLSAITVATLVAVLFVSVQHRLHFLTCALVGLLLLYAVLGVWNYTRNST